MAEINKKSGKNNGIRHALTVEQQRSFMNYVAENPVFCNWTALFTVLLGTGCRIGEAVGLRWQDLDMEKRLISINHSLTYYPRREETYKCEFKVSLPKTEAGIRTLPMMQKVYDVFQYEYERQEDGFCSEVVDGMTGFIFTNRFGMPHNPASVNRVIKRIVDAHNADEVLKAKKEKRQPIMVPRFSCHIFRHTFCSRFCENETNVKVIQTVMGHASIETSMDINTEVTDDKKKEAIENLARNLDIF